MASSSRADQLAQEGLLDYVSLLDNSSADFLQGQCQLRMDAVQRQRSFEQRLATAAEPTADQVRLLRGLSSMATSVLHVGGGGLRPDRMRSTTLFNVGDNEPAEDEEENEEEEDDEEAEMREELGFDVSAAAGDVMVDSLLAAPNPEDLRSQFMRENLRQFAFGADSGQDRTVHGWNVCELTSIFNMFDRLDGKAEMVELFERCRDAQFKSTPIIVRGYCRALLALGKPVAVERFLLERFQLEQRLHDNDNDNDNDNDDGDGEQQQIVQLQGVLADAYKMLLGLGRELVRVAVALLTGRGGDAAGRYALEKKGAELVQAYVNACGPKTARPELSDVAQLVQLAEQAFVRAKSAYVRFFLRSRSYVPLVYLCSMHRAYLHHWSLLQPLAADCPLPAPAMPLASVAPYLDALLGLAAVALERDGGTASNDVYVHSALLEIAASSEKLHVHLPVIIATLLPKIRTQEHLRRLLFRLRYVRRMQVAAPSSTAVDDAVSVLQRAQSKFVRLGRIPLPPDVPVSQLSGDAKFNKLTFNFRGFIASSFPTYMPGNLQLCGARVPDILISSVDLPQLRRILDAWGLLDETDPRVFLRALVERVRTCFQTHLLQDLQSQSHSYFDACSDALILLSGIAQSARLGTRSLSNITATLLFLGDCREHCFVMLAFFYYWQNRRIDEHIVRLFRALHTDTDTAAVDAQRVRADLQLPRALLHSELRGTQVAVYAAVEMDAIYKFQGYEAQPSPSQLYTPRERRYGLEQYRAKQPLRAFDLWYSLFLLTYADGSRARVAVDKHVDAATFVPLLDTAPLPDADRLVDLQLLCRMENHCMTVWVPDTRNLDVVEMFDAFYNHHLPPSPYTFGEGVFFSAAAMQQYAGLIPAGSMAVKAAPDYLHEKHTDVYIELLDYSKRMEADCSAETHTHLQYCGVPLADLDIAAVISSPTFISARNKFSAGLLAWFRAVSQPPVQP